LREAVVHSPCNLLSTSDAKQLSSHFSRIQIGEVFKDCIVFVKLLNYGSYLLDSIKCLSSLIQYYYMYITVNGQSSVNRDSFIFFRLLLLSNYTFSRYGV
jgi:hypothetical protein